MCSLFRCLIVLVVAWGPAAMADHFIFTSAPKGTLAEESALYQPIADYLSKATGHQIEYRYTADWLSYQKEMLQGKYDLISDGPHFVGWRLEAMAHEPVVKLAGRHVFVVVAGARESRIEAVKDLAGRRVCAHASPNLGTLIMLSQFPNPARQPYLVEVSGWDKNFAGVKSHQCVATVLPERVLAKLDNGPEKVAKVIYQHLPLPNQAITAGPRIDSVLRARIAEALLNEDGRRATQAWREKYNVEALEPATRSEFVWLADLLKDIHGFGAKLAAARGARKTADRSGARL